MKRLLLALGLALTLTMTLVAPAEAAPPKATVALAKKIGCKWAEETSVMGGGKNSGVSCVVRSKKHGRQEFLIVRYRNVERASDFWRDWVGEGRYFARRGKYFFLPQGGGRGENADPYTYKWSRIAAIRGKARIIEGYPES